MNLDGQVALVTGASRGVGRAIAVELASQGAIVIGTATSEAGSEAISQYLAETREGSGRGMVLDVNDAERCNALVRQAAGPVRWVETMQQLAAGGTDLVIESAPSKVLVGMAKRIDARLVGEALVDQAALDRVLSTLS